MKYTPLNVKQEKVFHIPVPYQGVDFSKPSADIDDNSLADCKNVFFSNHSIKTRLGLKYNTQGVIDLSEMNGAESIDYSVTDTEIFVDGEFKKIVTADVKYSESHRFIYVYLMSADSSIKSIGNMFFSRIDSDTFYTPKQLTFYKGAPVQGGGIFALVTLQNEENQAEVDYKIYEVNSSLDGWERVNTFYIPTVYINGRGNNFEFLESSAINNKDEPMALESLNMLSGSFYAYYSSDGYSSSFRLPFSDLADSAVILRLHTAPETYIEWSIAAGEKEATQKIYDTEITLFVDRKKGMIYFKKGTEDFAVPVMSTYKENNIRIFAQKDITGGYEAIVTARCAVSCGQSIILAGDYSGNRLFYADYENPLYFPLISYNAVGSPDMPITALRTSKERIYAFKEKEIYTADIKRGKAINRMALLADNGKIFKSNDSFSVNCISNSVGCSAVNSLKFYKNKPIWYSGGKVYTLEATGNNAVILSNTVGGLLKKEFDSYNVCGASFGNNYILCSGRKAVIMYYIKGAPAWFVWEFPENVRLFGGFGDGEKNAFICQNVNNGLCYSAQLSGENDILPDADGNEKVYEIESLIKTKSFSLGSFSKCKRINRIFLRLWAQKGVKIEIGTEKQNKVLVYENAISGYKGEYLSRLLTDIRGLRQVHITLTSHKGISLGEADIYYFEAN